MKDITLIDLYARKAVKELIEAIKKNAIKEEIEYFKKKVGVK